MDNLGVSIINGPVAISFLVTELELLIIFGNNRIPSIFVVSVIGGPGDGLVYYIVITEITQILPSTPMKIVKPKQAKNNTKIITNSLLCIEYNRIWTDLKQVIKIFSKEIFDQRFYFRSIKIAL